MNVETLRQYIKARDLYHAGDTQAAYDHLVSGMPRKPKDGFLRENLHRMMDVDTPAGLALLELVGTEAAIQREDEDD